MREMTGGVGVVTSGGGQDGTNRTGRAGSGADRPPDVVGQFTGRLIEVDVSHGEPAPDDGDHRAQGEGLDQGGREGASSPDSWCAWIQWAIGVSRASWEWRISRAFAMPRRSEVTEWMRRAASGRSRTKSR